MDKFNAHTGSLTSPARRARMVTPSDAALAQVTRAVYIGGAGNLDVEMVDGDRVVFQGLPAGTFLPIRVLRIFETDTSAAAILALW